jgi:hypothetical protein
MASLGWGCDRRLAGGISLGRCVADSTRAVLKGVLRHFHGRAGYHPPQGEVDFQDFLHGFLPRILFPRAVEGLLTRPATMSSGPGTTFTWVNRISGLHLPQSGTQRGPALVLEPGEN